MNSSATQPLKNEDIGYERPPSGPIPKSSITIYDVAQRAGVSPATVSRILAGFVVYKEETRERVFRTVREMGYQPNPYARKLAMSRTETRAS